MRRASSRTRSGSHWSAPAAPGFLVILAAHVLGQLQDTPVSYLLLAACLAPPSLFFMIVANVLTGQERFVEFNVLEAVSRAAAVGGIVVAGVIGAGAGWLCRRGDRDVDRIRARDRGSRSAGASPPSPVRSSLVHCWPAVLDEGVRDHAARLSGPRANVFLLRRDYGPAELGLYSIAAQFSDVLAIVPQATALVLFPRLVRTTADRWNATIRATVDNGGSWSSRAA